MKSQRALVGVLLAVGAACAATLAVAGGAVELPWGRDPPVGPALARAADMRALGQRLFFERTLSGSGTMSCATCHSPGNHFSPDNALSVQAGSRLDRHGTRATPSLSYTAATPFFAEHYYDSDDGGNESLDEGPTGGRTWDGRVNRPREQAAFPLLDANEMNNKSERAVVQRVAAGALAGEMRRLFGRDIFKDTHGAFMAIGEALEAYQETPAQFSPFSSKYDAYLRGEAQLSPQEARGLAVFNDPGRGNCAQCHRSQLTPLGHLPLFTDFGYIALGVPRNRAIPANADAAYFDLGMCGPVRQDLRDRPEYCGLFKTPSLRNVATRHAFYHNGVFHTLQDAVGFYATRDTQPQRWYPRTADGGVRKFDDLPARYHGNVNVEPPFGGEAGGKPLLSVGDVEDIVVFLNTLTDGYVGEQAGLGKADVKAEAGRPGS